MEMKPTKRAFVVTFDNVSGDKAVMLVGEEKNRIMTVISAFQGEEAIKLYNKLISKGCMK